MNAVNVSKPVLVIQPVLSRVVLLIQWEFYNFVLMRVYAVFLNVTIMELMHLMYVV